MPKPPRFPGLSWLKQKWKAKKKRHQNNSQPSSATAAQAAPRSTPTYTAPFAVPASHSVSPVPLSTLTHTAPVAVTAAHPVSHVKRRADAYESESVVASESDSTTSSPASLFDGAGRQGSRYFDEDGEVRYLARPYWAPFRRDPHAQESTGRGAVGYIKHPTTNTTPLADLGRGAGSSGVPPVETYSQRVLNAADSSALSQNLAKAILR